MLTVNEVAKLTGITIRSLHYYDEINLLKPSIIGKNGYRYYDDESLLLIQQILLYRELGIPLIEIQSCIEKWRTHMNYFWTPNLEQLLEIATAYSEDERFRKTFDKIDPRLAEFIKEAVTFYAKKQNFKN
jgi:DNA-binding transcriptional MerR regulator